MARGSVLEEGPFGLGSLVHCSGRHVVKGDRGTTRSADHDLGPMDRPPRTRDSPPPPEWEEQSPCDPPRGVGGSGGWQKAMVLVCLPLAAPIGLSPSHILTLRGSDRVLVVPTEPPDDLTRGGGGHAEDPNPTFPKFCSAPSTL